MPATLVGRAIAALTWIKAPPRASLHQCNIGGLHVLGAIAALYKLRQIFTLDRAIARDPRRDDSGAAGALA
jgi:hypothetical protein